MGQKKYFRFNIKQHIHSIEYKTKYFYFKNTNISRYGLCYAEAELLANIADDFYQNCLLNIPENHFSILVYDSYNSHKKINYETLPKKTVHIPAFSNHELEFYSKYGLKALQNYRIINILDSIAFQNAKIDINLLSKIVNITPKSIRERLYPFLKSNIKIPLICLSNKWNSSTSLFRYSKALKDFFLENQSIDDILEKLLISENEWNHLLFNFFQLSYGNTYQYSFSKPLLDEILSLKKDIEITNRYIEYSKLYPSISNQNQNNPKEYFCSILKSHFSFSNALVIDYLKLLENEALISNKNRRHGEIIYYAVSNNTISGTSLEETNFVPVKLTIYSEEDNLPNSPYETATRKWKKALRYSIQAKNQDAHLSQYDLSFLLGVSVAVVKNLIKKHHNENIPTRGYMEDIGPGVSHAEKIIKLYLEGYTETEIKFKTGHSYNSIENYLRNFTKVVGLTDLGLNLNQIRMTAKISYNLARKFHEIYKNYDNPTYAWMMAKIRNNFNGVIKKKLNLGKKYI